MRQALEVRLEADGLVVRQSRAEDACGVGNGGST